MALGEEVAGEEAMEEGGEESHAGQGGEDEGELVEVPGHVPGCRAAAMCCSARAASSGGSHKGPWYLPLVGKEPTGEKMARYIRAGEMNGLVWSAGQCIKGPRSTSPVLLDKPC